MSIARRGVCQEIQDSFRGVPDREEATPWRGWRSQFSQFGSLRFRFCDMASIVEVILTKATPIGRRLATCSTLRERHVSHSTARGSPARAVLARRHTLHGGFCQEFYACPFAWPRWASLGWRKPIMRTWVGLDTLTARPSVGTPRRCPANPYLGAGCRCFIHAHTI